MAASARPAAVLESIAEEGDGLQAALWAQRHNAAPDLHVVFHTMSGATVYTMNCQFDTSVGYLESYLNKACGDYLDWNQLWVLACTGVRRSPGVTKTLTRRHALFDDMKLIDLNCQRAFDGKVFIPVVIVHRNWFCRG